MQSASRAAKRRRAGADERLVDFFFEIGSLRKIARAHRQTLLTDDLSDNIASHSYRVALIGWTLALMEKADPYKVTVMCLLHDTDEARTNDHNWVHKRYVKLFEHESATEQLQKLPFSKEATAIKMEYMERMSKESKLAKDADLLDQLFLLKEYEHMGNKEASDWLKGRKASDLNPKTTRLYSKTATIIAREVFKSSKLPSDWWSDSWTDKNR